MSDEKQSKSAVARLVVLTAIVIGLFLAMRFLPIQQWLRSFNDWVGHMGAAGIFVFILVYAVATVLMAPGSILTIGAGFAFGLWKGFLAVSEAIARRNEKFREIDNAIGKQGAKLIFLLRLSPVIPFNLSNYFYGLTAVKFWPYVLASWIGMIPGTFLYVYIGTASKLAVSAAAGGEAVKHGWQYWTLISFGLAATVVVTIWVTKIARDALRRTETA